MHPCPPPPLSSCLSPQEVCVIQLVICHKVVQLQCCLLTVPGEAQQSALGVCVPV